MRVALALRPGLELRAAEFAVRFAHAYRGTLTYEVLRAAVIKRFPWAERSSLICAFMLDVLMNAYVSRTQRQSS